MIYDIKNMVKDGKTVRFIHAKHGELWYVTECGFVFSVPFDDMGEATFLAVDKAMLFMRYIRKQIERNKEALAEIGAATG